MANHYLRPSEEPCKADVWKQIPPSEYDLRIFEDNRVRVILSTKRYITCHGNGADAIPKEHRKPYLVTVYNIIRDDPVSGMPLDESNYVIDTDATRDYRTLDEAKKAYANFLVRYSASHFDEKTGDFIEVGNKVAPPDPDVPVLEEDSPLKDEVGSW
jgi:hypothetical protein